ncbi:MAG: glycosyltransferase [Actinobacteria bacterium]|nr:glycosyltransferase [Actinomycetota bacterium]
MQIKSSIVEAVESEYDKDKTSEVLDDSVIEVIKELKDVDIVVGIPSFNNEATISKVVTSFGEGLKKYYPDFKCIIVNADGQSMDRTVEMVEKAQVPRGVRKITTYYKGPRGKGSALRTIFEIARRLEAKVCVVSDADTRSITPEWTYALVNPVLCLGYGYVTPYYSRDKHDATITNALVYPTIRALYGLRIRQPIGGDFAFSNGVLQVLTRKIYWEKYPYISKFGVDVWMTTTAMNEGFRVCQTVLGSKVHDVKDPGKDLSPMFMQVVGTMFDLMKYYEFRWRNVIGSIQSYIFGKFKFTEVERISVNFDELIQKFSTGYEKYKNVWKAMFDKDTYLEFRKAINSYPLEELVISVELWAKIVYEFACAYNFVRPEEKELVLQSMIPFYFIRTASFIKEAMLFSDEIADAVVEGNAGVFERLKDYLVSRWDCYKKKGELFSFADKVL